MPLSIAEFNLCIKRAPLVTDQQAIVNVRGRLPYQDDGEFSYGRTR